jgi:hypothetical protein
VVHDGIACTTFLAQSGCAGRSPRYAHTNQPIASRRLAARVQACQHLIEEGCVATCAGHCQRVHQFLIVIDIDSIQVHGTKLLPGKRADVADVHGNILADGSCDGQVKVFDIGFGELRVVLNEAQAATINGDHPTGGTCRPHGR